MLFTKPSQSNYQKFGKNKPFLVWPIERIQKSDNLTYLCTGEPTTLFNGRYCAVSGFIYAIVNGKYSILANLRGNGTPDYQGYWNVPCGYLEMYEDDKEGIAREILEECGFQIDLNDLRFDYIETEPVSSNHGNVTIRYVAFIGKIIPHYTERKGGEENEVDDVRWIPIDEVDKYSWAFNHLKIIKKTSPREWRRKLIELVFRYLPYNKTYI